MPRPQMAAPMKKLSPIAAHMRRAAEDGVGEAVAEVAHAAQVRRTLRATPHSAPATVHDDKGMAEELELERFREGVPHQ